MARDDYLLSLAVALVVLGTARGSSSPAFGHTETGNQWRLDALGRDIRVVDQSQKALYIKVKHF